MNTLAKMMTVIKGGINDVGEAIADSQAMRILDQEIREASEELKQSNDNYLELMAHKKVSEEKSKKLREEIAELEGYALKALDQNADELALEIAEKLSLFEIELEREEKIGKGFSENANDLSQAIKSAERNIRQIKQQLDTVKATENVQKAQSAVSKRYNGSSTKLTTAMNSLERIRQRQIIRAAKMDGANALSEEKGELSLEEKLEAAGIKPKKHSPDEILARLKKRAE